MVASGDLLCSRYKLERHPQSRITLNASVRLAPNRRGYVEGNQEWIDREELKMETTALLVLRLRRRRLFGLAGWALFQHQGFLRI